MDVQVNTSVDANLSEEQLKAVLDRVTREVTENSGIQLLQGDSELKPGDDVCTVHINFRRGICSNLSMRADTAMLTRLARTMLREDEVTPEDLEDVTKEYFNILCGQIAAALFKATHVASRFGVPSFHRGDYRLEDGREQFVLNYSSDQNEAAQLAHSVPAPQEEADGAVKPNLSERGDKNDG